MLGKVITSYFNSLKAKVLDRFGIKVDTFYTSEMDDFRQAMSNFSLRQMYDFNKLASAKITPEMLKEIQSNSYNYILYQYSPVVRSEIRPNNEIFEVVFEKDGETHVGELYDGKKFTPLPREQEYIALAHFNEAKKTNGIELVGYEDDDFDPDLPKPDLGPYMRIGANCETTLTCRLCTADIQLFENFQIIYNSLLLRNPPAEVEVDGVTQPITCKYEPISTAQMLDQNRYGNLMIIEFNVKLSTMFYTSYVKDVSKIREIQIALGINDKAR